MTRETLMPGTIVPGARRAIALRLAAVGVALPLLLSAAPAQAHDVETGSGVICDTHEQAQRLALLLEDDAQAAIGAVNAETHNATACALATVAYVRGAKVGMARSKASTFEIVEVLVVGVKTPRGMQHASPAVYFTLFRVEERPA